MHLPTTTKAMMHIVFTTELSFNGLKLPNNATVAVTLPQHNHMLHQ